MGKVVLVFDSNPLQLLWIQSPANYVNTIVRNACLMSAGNPQPTDRHRAVLVAGILDKYTNIKTVNFISLTTHIFKEIKAKQNETT